jgi:hypothetical protein
VVQDIFRINLSALLLLVVLPALAQLGSTAEARSAKGRSALSVRTPKALPPQLFDKSAYDDVVELEAKTVAEYLNYKGSDLDPITLVKVRCYLDTATNASAPGVDYLDLWCRKDLSIGQRQSMSVPIKERGRVAILLKSQLAAYNDAQIAAFACALVRLRLILGLNGNAIALVRVPDQSLDLMISALRRHNFLPYREVSAGMTALIPITLESDLGRKQVLCFAPSN